MAHANSHIVFLRRKPSHLEKIQKDIPEFMSRSKKYVGSFFESTTSRIIGSGLTIAEQKLLLPEINGIEPTDKEFKKGVIVFYQEMATEVPYGNGTKLEIGLEKSNEAELSADNMPLKIMDFLRYRHAKNHPRVGSDEDATIGDMLKDFFISDPEALKSADNKAASTRDLANAKYLGIKNKPEIVEALIITYGENPDSYISNEDRITRLSTLVTEKPDILLGAMADASLQTRATLKKLVEHNLVNIIDSAYYLVEDKTNIGTNQDQAVTWLQDNAKNGNTIILLKQKLQEARKQAKK
jgi:hypothetical protein